MTDVVPHALTEVASGAPIDVDPRKAVSARTLAREQFLVTAGQVAAGAGNLAFALLMVRVLDRRGFTHLAVFLASYLLIHLPGTSFGAGTALRFNCLPGSPSTLGESTRP